jgi:hypothetical protein
MTGRAEPDPRRSVPLPHSKAWDWMPCRAGANMKQQQTREATPIRVWMAFGLIGIGIAAYLTGYLMIEEMLAFS